MEGASSRISFQSKATPKPVGPERPGKPRFYGPGTVAQFGQWVIRDAMTYLGGPVDYWIDHVLDPSLKLGDPAKAEPMPAWPRYLDLTPAQRARHVQWLASGRPVPTDPGHLLLLLASLQRRSLEDKADVEEIVVELERLASAVDSDPQVAWRLWQLLEFLVAGMVATAPEERVRNLLNGAQRWDTAAPMTVLAWYALRQLPVPADVMRAVLRGQPETRTSVVLDRAPQEFAALFARRYVDAYDGGLVPAAAARPHRLTYYPAWSGSRNFEVSLPNVFGRPAQLKRAFEVWNACIEDLKELSTVRRKYGGDAATLSVEEWQALPAELRSQVDHPRRERWFEAFTAGEGAGGVRITTLASVGSAAGFADADRFTAAQLRKIAEQADQVGFGIEPDGRQQSRGLPAATPVALWRATTEPASRRHGVEAAAAVLGLCLHVARADGDVADDEVRIAAHNVEALFELAEGDRMRLEAIRELFLRNPPKIAQLTKKLEGQPTEVRAGLGRLVVAVAAADGLITDGELRALRQLYRALGFSNADLDAALVESGARLADDELVEVARERRPTTDGESIPRPGAPAKSPGPTLDQVRIAALLSDSHEVTKMLAGIFADDEEPEPDTKSRPVPQASAAAPPATEPVQPADLPGGLAKHVDALDARYRGILAELITREEWSAAELRQMSTRSRLMPNAILEAINTWSDECLGDFLIEEADGWRIRREMLEECT